MVFLLQKTLVYAIPLLIVALAGMYAERSGIINIALDGIMIFGAFVGALCTTLLRKTPFFVDHSQITFIIAMFVAAVGGALFSLLLSFSAIKLKADQTIGGTALNMLAPALSLFLIKLIFRKDELEMARNMGGDGKLHDFGYVILNDKATGLARVLFDRVYISTYIAAALFIFRYSFTRPNTVCVCARAESIRRRRTALVSTFTACAISEQRFPALLRALAVMSTLPR